MVGRLSLSNWLALVVERAPLSISPLHKPDSSVSVLPLGRRRIGYLLLLPTIGILLLIAGLGLALILYLLTKKIPNQTLQQIIFVNGSLYAEEGLKDLQDGRQEVKLQGLLITSFTVGFVSFSDNPD
jgi:hypothetical protein